MSKKTQNKLSNIIVFLLGALVCSYGFVAFIEIAIAKGG